MRENLTYGLMWQGVETASFDARRHLLTLPADGDGQRSRNPEGRAPQLKRETLAFRKHLMSDPGKWSEWYQNERHIFETLTARLVRLMTELLEAEGIQYRLESRTKTVESFSAIAGLKSPSTPLRHCWKWSKFVDPKTRRLGVPPSVVQRLWSRCWLLSGVPQEGMKKGFDVRAT